MGNLPTLLMSRPMIANPKAYKISNTIPCSNVASSSFVMQAY